MGWRTLTGIAAVLAVAAAAALSSIYHPERAIRIATGAVADALCAKTFVSGLDPQISFAEILEQQLRRYMRSSNALMHDTGEIGDQHRPLVDAILAGQAGEAEALAKSHNMTEGRKLYTKLLQIEQRTALQPATATAGVAQSIALDRQQQE